MKETGIIAKHQHHWMAPKPPCLSDALFSNVDFASTMASIGLLLIGYTLALMIFLVELIFHAYTQKHNIAEARQLLLKLNRMNFIRTGCTKQKL